MSLTLSEIGRIVSDVDVRHAALEAFAQPITEQARQNAGSIAYFKKPTGHLAKNIAQTWSFLKPNIISIGWTQEGYYGFFLERGFSHYAKHQNRNFIKHEHIVPAYRAKMLVGSDAAVAVLRKALEGVK